MAAVWNTCVFVKNGLRPQPRNPKVDLKAGQLSEDIPAAMQSRDYPRKFRSMLPMVSILPRQPPPPNSASNALGSAKGTAGTLTYTVTIGGNNHTVGIDFQCNIRMDNKFTARSSESSPLKVTVTPYLPSDCPLQGYSFISRKELQEIKLLMADSR